MKEKRGQASFEYMILMGFVTLILGIILGISFFYTSSTSDNIRINQMNTFANKVVSTAEYVFSAGEPSKSTISAYLPEGITAINITEDTLLITIITSSGTNIIGFPSDVNITGNITTSPGIKTLAIEAKSNGAVISAA